jgi:haloacetate dehalogenase
MFEGFASSLIDVGETTILARHGGSGPPLLLLHGFPQTHLMWHKVAPRLAEEFTVVATDLRGCGGSGKPPTLPDHSPYAMRALACDQLAVMEQLGFAHFGVAGHDRGARCAYRMALDHPGRVTRLAVLDIVPTGEVFARADMAFALDFWIWSFLAAPHDLPERLIGANPDLIVDHALDSWSIRRNAFPDDVRAEYRRAFRNPETIHSVCEQYRAAAALDYRYDTADRGSRRIACPVLVLWGKHSAVDAWYDPLAVWRAWADNVRGRALDCGHFLPEEAPEESFTALNPFFRGDDNPDRRSTATPHQLRVQGPSGKQVPERDAG